MQRCFFAIEPCHHSFAHQEESKEQLCHSACTVRHIFKNIFYLLCSQSKHSKGKNDNGKNRGTGRNANFPPLLIDQMKGLPILCLPPFPPASRSDRKDIQLTEQKILQRDNLGRKCSHRLSKVLILFQQKSYFGLT